MYCPRTFDNVHLSLRVLDARHAAGFDHDVGDEVVQTITHFRRETSHHAVHNDHGRNAQHHTDNACQCDVFGSQITNTQQQLVLERTPCGRELFAEPILVLRQTSAFTGAVSKSLPDSRNGAKPSVGAKPEGSRPFRYFQKRRFFRDYS